MWKESSETKTPLKTGLTTGSCATACCVAAAQALLTDTQTSIVSITLPKGKTVELTINKYNRRDNSMVAATVKDAGDDPDVTHGATVFVQLSLLEKPDIVFIAGDGVGTVTRKGLELSVGEPAINPVPRKMMQDHLQMIAKKNNYQGGFEVSVGVVNGEAIAQKTMNPRLGILKGLSILGTTGIVRPFSCSAWIASIHQGIDVAKANGITHVAATTGNTSEESIRKHYQLTDIALIEMGDFAGAVFKHLKKVPVQHLTLCGGFGKMTKLANGHMDLNSRVSSIDFPHMAGVAKKLGASEEICKKIVQSNTSMEVLALCVENNIDIANTICDLALQKAQSIMPAGIQVDVWAVDRKGHFVGHAGIDQTNKKGIA